MVEVNFIQHRSDKKAGIIRFKTIIYYQTLALDGVVQIIEQNYLGEKQLGEMCKTKKMLIIYGCIDDGWIKYKRSVA